MADTEFEEFRQFFEQLPQHIKAPSNCYTLAHDIALETPSPEDAPDPPDPPSTEGEEGGEEGEKKCCSDDNNICPELVGKQGRVIIPSPPPQPLLPTTHASPSPICGSPGPRKPHSSPSKKISNFENLVLEVEDELAADFLGDFEDDGEGGLGEDDDDPPLFLLPPQLEGKTGERKRRKLPEIPKDKKCFSRATILALRTPNLAEELHEAESGVASRTSTPDHTPYHLLTNNNNNYSNTNNNNDTPQLPPNSSSSISSGGGGGGGDVNPILVLKCHAFLRDDSTSPDSEARLPTDIDSGHSTQHSPDGPKSISPLATVNGSLSPCSPSSMGVPFPQLGLLEATHRGLYRFIPRHHDEVHIEIGDPIYVQREADDLWCEGVNLRTGRQGIFPAAHVTDVDYSDFDPSVPKVKKERYLLSYLGSIETLCHKGNEVLCQAVRKIAGGEESAQHPHPCILEVSDQGIRMVDKSKPPRHQSPCHDYFYHLKHVSFCAFHPKDHRYFGFITKHPRGRRFACHIFRSNDTTRPVAEAVGRAFQRFYQKFIETAYPIEDIYME